jgi:predicted O-methyltransferase YrrM
MVPAAMTFTEDWFGDESQEVLAGLVKSVASIDGQIIEIGAWEGRSTLAMANAAWPRVIDTVDTWEGSPNEPSEELAAQRDVHATWVDNVKEGTKGNVIEHRMGWREFVPTEPVALVFIDAEHTYKEVFDAITAFLPHMAPGGIICGDDWHHPPIQQAIGDVLDPHRVKLGATVWVWQKPHDSIELQHQSNCTIVSDIHQHLPLLATMGSNAQHIVELGARSGMSTTAFLCGLNKSGGRLTSVDLDAAPDIPGQHDNWVHIQGDDTDLEVLAQVDDCDILFVDTSHHYEHTLWELRNWSAKVRDGGIIVCHDTELQRPWDPPCPETDPDFPVAQAIDEFCAENGYKWINVPGCWGLGIIEVRAT